MSARVVAAISLVGAAVVLAIVLLRRRASSSSPSPAAAAPVASGPPALSAEDLGRALELALGSNPAKPPRQSYYDATGALVSAAPGYATTQGYAAATPAPAATVTAPASPVARATPSMVVAPVAATTNQTVAPAAPASPAAAPGADRGWDWGNYGTTLGRPLVRGWSVDQRGRNVQAKGYAGSTYTKEPDRSNPPTQAEWNEVFAARRSVGLQASGF